MTSALLCLIISLEISGVVTMLWQKMNRPLALCQLNTRERTGNATLSQGLGAPDSVHNILGQLSGRGNVQLAVWEDLSSAFPHFHHLRGKRELQIWCSGGWDTDLRFSQPCGTTVELFVLNKVSFLTTHTCVHTHTPWSCGGSCRYRGSSLAVELGTADHEEDSLSAHVCLDSLARVHRKHWFKNGFLFFQIYFYYYIFFLGRCYHHSHIYPD